MADSTLAEWLPLSTTTFTQTYLVPLVLCFCLFGANVLAEEPEQCNIIPGQTYRLEAITVITNNIFEEDGEDAIALHSWANNLHIITKPSVIKERLPFDEGDTVTEKDIIEAEALIRALRYIANAEITPVVDCVENTVTLNVTTWDNWSLIPTLSFTRSGGQDSTIVGFREDNLLGLGVRASLRYTDNEQRTGYQLGISTPLQWLRHANLSINAADNDDGEVYSVAINKPFYHLDSEDSILLSAEHRTQVDDIYQNDIIRNSILIDANTATAGYGWRLSSNNTQSTRLTVGITEENSNFSIAAESPSGELSLVPEARDFLYTWIGYEFTERKIEVMEDVFLINQPEDINLGWHLYAQVGFELRDSNLGVHTKASAQKAFAVDNALVLFNSSLNAVTNAAITDYVQLDTNLEYLNRQSDHLAYYLGLNTTFTSGQYLDRPIVLDDNTGVRGLPFQYQHGDHRVNASAEIRWYADYNFYQLFEVGFAAFVDVGRAYGGEFAELNIDSDTLASAGVGMRFYSNKASKTGVLHVDFSRPFTDNAELDDWQFSVRLRRSF